MNIQHSSRTDRWYTPTAILERARQVLGEIDLDPASDEFGNSFVKAKRYITQAEDGLVTPWEGSTIWLNPPGGKTKNKSNTGLFWKKLMEYRASGKLDHAIFMAFSLEALQSSQGKGVPSIGEFMFCVPRKRIAFVSPAGVPEVAPSHSNAIVYVDGSMNDSHRFRAAFSDLGVIV